MENLDSKVSFSHVPMSYMFCREMATVGECRYGTECKFAHDEKGAQTRLHRIAAEKALAQAKRRGVCHVFFASGECPFGVKCRFAHLEGNEAERVVQANALRKQKKTERKQKNRGVDSSKDRVEISTVDSNDQVPFERTSFKEWITSKIKNLPQYSSFAALYDRCVEVIMTWRARFESEPKVWSRFIKGGGHRMIKELVESAPVIDRVWRHIVAMDDIHPNSRLAFDRVTIVDLCSGFGFLSMFLSELLPVHRVKKIIMVDNMWSRKALTANKDKALHSTMGTDTTKDCENRELLEQELADDEADELVLESTNSGVEEPTSSSGGRQYISTDHFTGRYACLWPIPIEASKQDIKSRATLRSMQKIIFDRAVESSRSDANHASETSRDGIIIIGVHLCGILSLRALDMFNMNISRVSLFILKPCCLPNTGHIKKSGSFVVGRHIIPCVEVCAAGKWVGNAVQGAWKGPPRNHLTGRFRSWAKHLMQGIDIAEGIGCVGTNEENASLLDQCFECQDIRVYDTPASPIDSIHVETRETTDSTDKDAPVGMDTKSSKILSVCSRWGVKSVEFFRVQEVGYQNLYVFAQQN